MGGESLANAQMGLSTCLFMADSSIICTHQRMDYTLKGSTVNLDLTVPKATLVQKHQCHLDKEEISTFYF